MSVSFFIVPDGFFQIVASAFDYLLTYSKLSTQIKQKLYISDWDQDKANGLYQMKKDLLNW
jgi:hypothetical protein